MRKVKYARFHTEVYLPGAGSLGTVLPSTGKTLENLEMSTDSLNLTVKFGFRGSEKELLIPHGNISILDLEPLESRKPTK